MKFLGKKTGFEEVSQDLRLATLRFVLTILSQYYSGFPEASPSGRRAGNIGQDFLAT